MKYHHIDCEGLPIHMRNALNPAKGNNVPSDLFSFPLRQRFRPVPIQQLNTLFFHALGVDVLFDFSCDACRYYPGIRLVSQLFKPFTLSVQT